MTHETDRPWLVAIDTSTDWAGVGLTDGTTFAELNWSAGRRQTVRMLVEIDRLRETVGIEIGQIGAVGVAIGPGSFSCLRVGLSIAKGMVIASDLALIGISTMDMTVAGAYSNTASVIGVIKGGRSRYVWATRERSAEFQSGTIQELAEAVVRMGSESIILGEYSDVDAETLFRETGAQVSPAPGRYRRAGILAELSWKRWQAGDWDNSAEIEPRYLHHSTPAPS